MCFEGVFSKKKKILVESELEDLKQSVKLDISRRNYSVENRLIPTNE